MVVSERTIMFLTNWSKLSEQFPSNAQLKREQKYIFFHAINPWPQNPTNKVTRWGVISRGAVIKGLSNSIETDTVTNYISKQSYGVLHNAFFNPAEHSEKDKYKCEYRGVYMARDQFTWYLKRVSDHFNQGST